MTFIHGEIINLLFWLDFFTIIYNKYFFFVNFTPKIKGKNFRSKFCVKTNLKNEWQHLI